MNRITVYTRPKCHLCEQVLAVLLQRGTDFQEIDISKDPALEGEFGLLVPVVQVNGRIIHEAGMEVSALSARLTEVADG